MRIRQLIGIILALGLLTSASSLAQDMNAPKAEEDAIGQTPPRLSFTKGEVSFWRPGAQDWSQAQINTPLAPGDQLYSGSQGNLEIQVGARAYVRGGANTQIALENQEPDFLQLKVSEGNASFDLRTVEPGRTVEVDTPNAAFTIEHAGYYRVDVAGDRTSFITRRGGEATVTSAGGEAVLIEPSEEVVIAGSESPQVTSYAAPQLDEWDKWNYARTDHLLDAVSARYVSPGMYGVSDLDPYGTWRNVPTYGAVWVPRGVPVGWSPYSTGSWMLDPYYGWTWVDTAPWGWAPYHYGRWAYVDGFWGWAPGPVVVRPAYAPALVAFLGGPSVSVGIGIGPLVGWVALGWGEPCVPWWGPTTFRHRAWWGGWAGPRVVNNVVINRTTVVNVQEINVYRNTTVRNAVVAVDQNHFGRGPIKSARVTQVDERNFHPIHTAPQVTATPASFVPRESRGIRPPEKVLERSVVATRPPHPRSETASGEERGAGPGRVPSPKPRIVSAPQQREAAPGLQRPPFGQSKVERRTNDRERPPVPPRMEGRQRPESVPGATPSVSPQMTRQQRELQATAPSPAKPEAAIRQPETRQVQQPASPKVEEKRRPEPARASTPPVSPQTTRQQRELQATAPSPAKPQATIRQPEASHARQPAPQAVRPPAATPQPSGRPAEQMRAPGRALPGEPANRLSPNRTETRPQQKSMERKEPQQHPEARPEIAPENAPHQKQGK